jgi:hypothetical protein
LLATIIDIRPTEVFALQCNVSGVREHAMQRGFGKDTADRVRAARRPAPRSAILVASSTPQHVACMWKVTAADVQWTDALYPLAQHAMQRGYYMPKRNSNGCIRHQCQHWRCCERDFGGVVEA